MDRLEQILNKLVAKSHGLPSDDLPDNVGLLMPNLYVQQAKSAIQDLITEEKQQMYNRIYKATFPDPSEELTKDNVNAVAQRTIDELRRIQAELEQLRSKFK